MSPRMSHRTTSTPESVSCQTLSMGEKSLQIKESIVVEGLSEEDNKNTTIATGWKDEDIVYPDGGLRAWLIVAGAMCTTFSTFGFAIAWGVFQSYYETTVLTTTSPGTIAWIGSIQYALVFVPGIFMGRLCDLGYLRIPLAIGTVFTVAATFLIAECTQYWQFLLCHGIFLGLGSGICFGAAFPIVGHWFYKRRGMALGTVALGASAGGTVYPIAARQLIPLVGFPWAMRIMGFMMLATLGFANLTLARRLPPKDMPGGIFNIKVFQSKIFSIYCSSVFVCFLGIYTVLTYIDVGATRIGISPDFSFYLVSIANASAATSRVLTGILADRYGAVNVIVPMTWSAAILTFAWPYAKSRGSLIVLAVLYGFSNSAFVSAFNMPLYTLGEMGDIGRRVGTVMMFTAVGSLVGPPISGAIYKETGGFESVSYYAGTSIIVSTILMLWSRYLYLGGWRGKW
ncbi:major facilitator superfamily domain-containing protein [Coprinopsis sp. MPI-PUGE-AT-0042]|nr:major facilitator superfamily domain-containing protein [Coprinopsis sp. MPI-PUGE-AT-0042]